MSRSGVLVLMVVSALSGAGCGGLPTCQPDDFACYTKNMALFAVDRQTFDETEVGLTELPAAAIQALMPPNGAGVFPKFTGGYSLSATEWNVYPEDESLVELEWEDPTGSSPSPCMRHCPRGMMCTGSYRCPGSLRDGLRNGISLYGVVYNAQPAQPSQTLDIEVVPIASSTGDAVPAISDWVNRGSPASSLPAGVSAGPAVVVKQLMQRQKGGDGPTGCTKEGEACSKDDPRCFSGRNCIVNVMAAGCECSGTVSGQCGPVGATRCNSAGLVCGDRLHACCPGLQCTNGKCEGPDGRCPTQ